MQTFPSPNDPPRMITNRKKIVHCRGCGHRIPQGDKVVIQPYLNCYSQRRLHYFHLDPVCLNREKVETFKGDPR